jgi:hypothetical protein
MNLFARFAMLVAAAMAFFPPEAAARLAGNHNETLVRD